MVHEKIHQLECLVSRSNFSSSSKRYRSACAHYHLKVVVSLFSFEPSFAGIQCLRTTLLCIAGAVTQRESRCTMLSASLCQSLCYLNRVQRNLAVGRMLQVCATMTHYMVVFRARHCTNAFPFFVGVCTGAYLKNLSVGFELSANQLPATACHFIRQARILVLSVAPDSAFQYMPMMNSIFAAAKKVCIEIDISMQHMSLHSILTMQLQSVTIDACVLGDKESGFLQQASEITGGIHSRVGRGTGFLEHLLVQRSQSATPPQPSLKRVGHFCTGHVPC